MAVVDEPDRPAPTGPIDGTPNGAGEQIRAVRPATCSLA